MQGNGLKKFRTIVSEVSSFVGNPVHKREYKILPFLVEGIAGEKLVLETLTSSLRLTGAEGIR